MNKGLTEELINSFPDVTPVERPIVDAPENIDPNWLAGFAEGESCFGVTITKSQTKTGFIVLLRFRITLHERDRALWSLIVKNLNCGILNKSRKSVVEFSVSRLNDIHNKIIPFFEKYPLQGKKRLDYADFCKVALFMKDKAHLTEKGLEQIRLLKANMNSKRES